MFLVRQVFQVKYNCMDKVMNLFQSMPQAEQERMGMSRVLTDVSGKNFQLVLEMEVESVDAFVKQLENMDGGGGAEDALNQYIESGHKEFYTIQYTRT